MLKCFQFQCVDFMTIYVESLTNLLHRKEKRSDICVQVGKCFRNGDNSMFVEINEGMKIEPLTQPTNGNQRNF